MKKIVFIISLGFVILTFASCKKNNDSVSSYLPTMQGSYMVPDSSDTYPARVIRIGDKVCELHTTPHGDYIKLISGFPKEYIGKEMLNQELFLYYFHNVKDTLLLQHTFYYLNQWQNWFKRNESEGLGYSYPLMGMFLQDKDSPGTGEFFLTGETFISWFAEQSVYHFNNETEHGLPSAGPTWEQLKQGKVFLPVIYFKEKFFSK